MSAQAKDDEQALIDLVTSYSDDPLGYVLAAFEWGSGELAGFDGPDTWQRETLEIISESIKLGKITVEEAIQIAVSSGHGIGKSALVAWIILWAMSTYEETKGVVTANTENQLKTKTWAELAKWHRLCINAHWFEVTATAIFSKDKAHEKTWRIDMVAWSERNTEAFAGLHNKGKRIVVIFDEASAIPDSIWEVSEGALTDSDTEIIWCVFGNPTRNIGRFRECFQGGKFAHRWNHRQIDSRDVKITNKMQLQKLIDDYGEDHDVVRVRVRGVFPSASANALIGPDEIDAAMARYYVIEQISHAAVVLGGDVARQGDDDSAIARRQGLVMYPIRAIHIPDTVLVAAQFSLDYDTYKADAIFVDATGGYGVGVIDCMRQTHHNPIEVYFNGKAIDSRYFNKRSEMYFELVEWVRGGGALPLDPLLKEELIATTYTFNKDKFRLCDKDDVKEVIGRSPDRADAAALTFAYPVNKKDPYESASNTPKEYDPYANIK